MSFQDPAALWFALLLVVPLVLYLLPLPRRLIKASALYLWQRFLSSEPFGRASERFRRALGFALLAAILASLVLAAADLTVGSTSVKARGAVVIVDVSASMNAVVDGKTNLSRAKQAAAQFVESLGGGAQVAVAETSGRLEVLRPMGAGGREAIARIDRIEPFEGPCDMRRALAEAWGLWGDKPEVEVYVFTDNELPDSPWGQRAHAWIAPAVGEDGNAGIIAISAERSSAGSGEQRGREVTVNFTLANYGQAQRTLSGVIICNGQARGSFESTQLEGGATAKKTVKFEEPGAAAVMVKLEGNKDALAADDFACVNVPALDEMRVGVVWPTRDDTATAPAKGPVIFLRNDYVAAVLSAMQDEGLIGSIVENAAERKIATPVTVYVNQLPAQWPDGGAIVLYPLRSGVIDVGLHAEPVMVARQAGHDLLAGVDLRGLAVRNAVLAAVPQWATPLVWADNNLPLVWAGQTGKTKVLFVGISAMPSGPSGSRLPLIASFPVLMRNTLQWMLPPAEALRPGERAGEWTSRKAGLVKGPDARTHAFSVASAGESDLRRPPGLKGETFGRGHSLAMFLVVLAIALLPIEWGLFHKRLTE
ncbi:MAG: VWA domain-containing protein [Phycisphaerae bacterium]